MAKPVPLRILESEFLSPDQQAVVESLAAKIEELPLVRPLLELQSPPERDDPDELIRRRFLCRGAICLAIGPTGVGKSSFLMQLGLHLTVGKPCFDLAPGDVYQRQGMQILMVQAENDDGDLAEMRDGVLRGCDLSDADKLLAQRRLRVCTVADRTRERFVQTLHRLVSEPGPFDLLIIDPAFAYLGGESKSQKDVSHFMRELLHPLLQRHGIGLILAHHTNKPPTGKEKGGWAAGDFAYLGAGSAEWINPARAALAIRAIGSDSVFELRAAKRGKRLRWTDGDGRATCVRYIAHHREAGVICWRDADPDEVEELVEQKKGGRPRQADPSEVLHCIAANEGCSQAECKKRAARILDCSPSTIQNLLKSAEKAGWVRLQKQGNQMLYWLTEPGRAHAAKHPSVYDWRAG